MTAVLNREERPQSPAWASASPDVVPLMERCWKQDPAERPDGFGPVVQVLASVVSRVGDPRAQHTAGVEATPLSGAEVNDEALSVGAGLTPQMEGGGVDDMSSPLHPTPCPDLAHPEATAEKSSDGSPSAAGGSKDVPDLNKDGSRRDGSETAIPKAEEGYSPVADLPVATDGFSRSGGKSGPFKDLVKTSEQEVSVPTAPTVVVAIDFGTTRSAWAYRVSDHSDNRIFVRIPDTACASPSSTAKTETAALIGGAGRVDLLAFGAGALQQFTEDHSRENALFRWFKVDLCEILAGQTTVEGVTATSTAGDKARLIDVVTASLVYFKDDVLDFLSSTSGRPVRATDVNWILTVPAIYDDFAKGFMRQAAHRAGMIDAVSSAKLRLCLEPEVACLAVTMEDNPLTCEAEGQKMMVLDCGGGTVDITTYNVVSVEPLKLAEVKAPIGGMWGSTYIDKAFKGWLESFLGVWFELIQTTQALVVITRAWESKKAAFPGRNPTQPLKLILSDLAQHGMSIQDLEHNNGEPSSFQVGGKKFIISLPPALVNSFFEPILDMIAECLQEIRLDPAMDDLHRVYVVGGFSKCPLLREIVQAELGRPNCRVVHAHEPGIAIVKGAVMFAENATIFNLRKARLTYGSEVLVPFDDKNLDHRRRRATGNIFEDTSGVTNIDGTFDVHLNVGDDIPANGVLTRGPYRPVSLTHTMSSFNIYASRSRDPKFVDEEGCFKVGQISFDLDMTQQTLKDRSYRVELKFGGPELTVKVLHHTEEREIADGVFMLSRMPEEEVCEKGNKQRWWSLSRPAKAAPRGDVRV